MVLNLGIGIVTPPVGCNLFFSMGLGEGSNCVKSIYSILLFMLFGLILVTYMPEIFIGLSELLEYT